MICTVFTVLCHCMQTSIHYWEGPGPVDHLFLLSYAHAQGFKHISGTDACTNAASLGLM